MLTVSIDHHLSLYLLTSISTKVSSTFSGYVNILFDVPQSPIPAIEPRRTTFLQCFYTSDMLFQIDTSEFSSYADDNTLFASKQNHKN